MSEPSQRVRNYLRTVGGRARVDRVMEATGLDRETILRGAGRAPGKTETKRPIHVTGDDDDQSLIECIWQ